MPFLEEEECCSRGFGSAMDFSEYNGHSVHLRSEPMAKQMKLERPEELYLSRNKNKAVTRQTAKNVSVCSEKASTTMEERMKMGGTSDSLVKTEQQEDCPVLEERPGSPGRAGVHEPEELVGLLEGAPETKGQGDGGTAEQRTPLTKGKEKAWRDVDREMEVERGSSNEEVAERMYKEEEMAQVDQEIGGPFEMEVECDSEEQNPAKKKSKERQAPEDACGTGRKAKKSRRKGAARKAEAERPSRKRKAKDDGGCKRKKSKKEESGKAEENKWKWWEEEKRDDGVKWHQLEHKGPYFAPPYEPLPKDVRFYYDGKPMKLSRAAEEIATFFAKMMDHDYTSKKIFQNNFFCDWTKAMTAEERKKIKDLKKCNFKEIHAYFVDKHEAQKALPKEEKQKLKEEAERIQEKYGYCLIDGHREKIGNFKIEPPGLFRGRGDHPKMGMLKKRIMPEDIIINCSRDSKIPKPPPGHKWKEVRCDNTVTWLASWTENIQGAIKYVMLNPSSKLKGEKDWQKYEVARRLKGVVDEIRCQYRADWKSKEMKKRQRSVALYFIDKLALRAGNEKEEGESADTVGCCSLRVEHIFLHSRLDGKENVVEFDFLGKDCIRYYNKVPVPKQVFKNLQLFMEHKDPGDDLFDRLTTTSLNKHLQDLMDGLTAKVFRTYNASITLQEQLEALTNEDDNVAAKLLSYNRANRAVAILCNHQRATPKTFEKSMQNLQCKIDAKKQQLMDAKKELRRAKADHKAKKDMKSKAAVEKKKKLIEKIEEQLEKLDLQATDKEENKQIALGTSKLNYLDPRISVAWCKRFGVPIEKIYNKTQREKFAWAIAMADEDFEF